MNKVSSPPLLLFSCSVASHSLRPHGLYHARLPCPSPSPRACSNSYPLNWWCHATISLLLSPSPLAFNLSQHQVFSKESALCIRWPKYWSFSINSPSEYSGLISFRIDWFDLLAFQRTLMSFLQHHSLKASILQRSAFFRFQLSSLKDVIICDEFPRWLSGKESSCQYRSSRRCGLAPWVGRSRGRGNGNPL